MGLRETRIRFNWGFVCSVVYLYIMSAKGSLQCAIIREAYVCSFLAAG